MMRLDFEMRESQEKDGRLRLAVSGELDLATAPALEERLGRLLTAGHYVRLDLSALAFIDASGIRVLIQAVETAHQDGGRLTVGPVAPQINRVLTVLHAKHLIMAENGNGA
jgi:anti-sigma B factor antagonist